MLLDHIPKIHKESELLENIKPVTYCSSSYSLSIVTDDLVFWQERKEPNVKFGFDNGPKNVGISEASSNLFSKECLAREYTFCR